MKRKNAFTLIELLAVIVVLAIIALIATPIVMNTIKSAQRGAAEISADSYIKQVETAVAEARLNHKKIPDGTYQIDEEGNLTGALLPDGKLKIEMNGKKPTSGTITINNGEVENSSTMTIGDYKISYNPTNKKYEATEKGNTTKTYTNGEVVYFNVDNGTKCSNYTETQSNTGTKSGCMKFYAFNDDGKDTVNLILDHNTTALVKWNSSGKNASGPKEVFNQLKTDTDGWKGTITPSNYTMDQTGQTSNAKYTIDYSSYKARLITVQEVAQITGNTTFDEKTATSEYYFDTNTSTQSATCKREVISGCNYGWLYDRTSKDCTKHGCLNNADSSMTGVGYWTSSSLAGRADNAWGVSYYAFANEVYVGSGAVYGVRPVITVLKSKLS